MAAMKTDMNQQRFNQAMNDGEITTVVSLLKSRVIDLDYRDVMHDLQTPLMRLCHSDIGQSNSITDVLELITDQMPDLNQQDTVGRTLSMHACIAHNAAMLEFAIANHCDIMISDRTGRNLMHYAVSTGNDVIADISLTHPQAVQAIMTLDAHGYSPLDLAKQKRYSTIARKLTAVLNRTTSNSTAGASGQKEAVRHEQPSAPPPDRNSAEHAHRRPEGKSQPLRPLSNVPSPVPLPHHSGESPGSDLQRSNMVSPHQLKEIVPHPPRRLAEAFHSSTIVPEKIEDGNEDVQLEKRHDSAFHTASGQPRKFHRPLGTPSSNPMASTFNSLNYTNENTDEHGNDKDLMHTERRPRPLPPCHGPNAKSASKQRQVISQFKESTHHNHVTNTGSASPTHSNLYHPSRELNDNIDIEHGLQSRTQAVRQSSLQKAASNDSTETFVSPSISGTHRLRGKERLPESHKELISLNSPVKHSSVELTSFLSPRPRPRHGQTRNALENRKVREGDTSVKAHFETRHTNSENDFSVFEETKVLTEQQTHRSKPNIQHKKQHEERQVKNDDTKKDRQRRPSLSLPDLRDMTGCLVTSHETFTLQDLLSLERSRKNDNSRGSNHSENTTGMKNGEEDDDDDQYDNAEIDGDSESSLDSCFDDGVNDSKERQSNLPAIKRSSLEKH